MSFTLRRAFFVAVMGLGVWSVDVQARAYWADLAADIRAKSDAVVAAPVGDYRLIEESSAITPQPTLRTSDYSAGFQRKWPVSTAKIILVAAPASSQWIPIDCTQSKISIPEMDKCYRGPDVGADKVVGIGHSPTNAGCGFEQYAATRNGSDKVSNARTLIVNRSKGYNCYVVIGLNYIENIKKQRAILRRSPSNWSSVEEISDAHGMYFDIPQRKCFGFYKPGPEWSYGLRYSVYGFICGDNNHGPITQSAIINFLSGIKVQEE